VEGEHGVELHIERVQAEDAGIYYCQATNHGGSSEISPVTVHVSCESHTLELCPCFVDIVMSNSINNYAHSELFQKMDMRN
jgi:hypothetical protein